MGRRSICRVCGKERAVRNRKGVCIGCSINKNIAVVKQLRAKKGKHYKKWKRNSKAALQNMP